MPLSLLVYLFYERGAGSLLCGHKVSAGAPWLLPHPGFKTGNVPTTPRSPRLTVAGTPGDVLPKRET